jgi:hypothetical protein
MISVPTQYKVYFKDEISSLLSGMNLTSLLNNLNEDNVPQIFKNANNNMESIRKYTSNNHSGHSPPLVPRMKMNSLSFILILYHSFIF